MGDTPFDVAAGRALGVPVLGVATGKYDAAALRAAGAAEVIRDFSEADRLLTWLAQILDG